MSERRALITDLEDATSNAETGGPEAQRHLLLVIGLALLYFLRQYGKDCGEE